MAAAYPGPYDVHVASHQGLVVDFARNVNKFPVTRYTQVVPVKKLNDYFLRMTIEEAGRILNTDLNDKKWPDGQPRPERNEGTESREYFPYRCERYQYGATLGDMTVENSDLDEISLHQSIYARQAMTGRTQMAVTALTTSGNYAASHVVSVNNFNAGNLGTNAGNWGDSTTATQNIKRSIIHACEVIKDDTLAAIDLNDLVLVINSELAGIISLSQEIVDYIKQSPEAAYFIKGEGKAFNPNSIYGLPDKLYGLPLVVEDSRKVTSAKGATTAKTKVLPTATPFIAARPGGLEAPVGPNFSTCCFFAQTEMGFEQVNDSINKRQLLNFIEVLDCQIVAPASGVLFTDVV
jgi:hypothetical protein